MDVAILLVIVASISAGVSGALASSWGFRRRLYQLEDEVALIQGIVTREVKVRAGQERWRKKDEIEERVEQLVQQTAVPAAPGRIPFWQRDWTKQG